MSFIELTKELLRKTLTENGDRAYKSTGSECLDYFSLAGGNRFSVMNYFSLFAGALYEDELTALKLLFYTRDPRYGMGERNMFRFLFNYLAESKNDKVKALIPYVVEYGRYDDLLCLVDTPYEDDMYDFIKKQLDKDIQLKKDGKSISLLAKWLPSINTSNDEARKLGRKIAEKLGYSLKEYRKVLSFLRKGYILENNLREKDYSFDYEGVPSVAMNKYRKAFLNNDNERYTSYLQEVEESKKGMKTKVLDIVRFIRQIRLELEVYNNHAKLPKEQKLYCDATWKTLLDESKFNKRTLVVRDGSYSMTSFYFDYFGSDIQKTYASPMDIADAICLLAASKLEGEFKDKFITFSSQPELVDTSKFKHIYEKVAYLRQFNDCTNTNLEAVYDLILEVYKSPRFKKEDALDQIMIVSDMQFDAATDHNIDKSVFENFKEQFEELGYPMPEIIFWNCSAYKTIPVSKDERGIKLISGSSKNTIDLVFNVASLDPLEFMNKVLEHYKFIDELFGG